MKLFFVIIGLLLIALGALPFLTSLGVPAMILTPLSRIPTFGLKPVILVVVGLVVLYFSVRR